MMSIKNTENVRRMADGRSSLIDDKLPNLLQAGRQVSQAAKYSVG